MNLCVSQPPNAGMNLGPGGIGPSGGQSLHSQSNLNDSMGSGMPPTSLMQSQLSNVSMMHQQGAGPHYSSSQAGGQQHYQGQQSMGMMSQGSQSNSMMPQRPIGTYRPSQQGSAPQFMGQEEFYGEQYGHTASSSEPLNQQYYPDGNHTDAQPSHTHLHTLTHTHSPEHTLHTFTHHLKPWNNPPHCGVAPKPFPLFSLPAFRVSPSLRSASQRPKSESSTPPPQSRFNLYLFTLFCLLLSYYLLYYPLPPSVRRCCSLIMIIVTPFLLVCRNFRSFLFRFFCCFL
uniref:SS18L1 subunit of BAF chromatin remodeling complex n=1 Tax=Astyanax mexicanus TaxID=7994 RepID=A0A3B1JII0_ASTMX